MTHMTKGQKPPPKSVSLQKLESRSKSLSLDRVQKLLSQGTISGSERSRKSEYREFLEKFNRSQEEIRDITNMQPSWRAQLGTFIPKVWALEPTNRPSIFNLKQDGKPMVLLVKRTPETWKVDLFRKTWEKRDKTDVKPVNFNLGVPAKGYPSTGAWGTPDPYKEARNSDPNKEIR